MNWEPYRIPISTTEASKSWGECVKYHCNSKTWTPLENKEDLQIENFELPLTDFSVKYTPFIHELLSDLIKKIWNTETRWTLKSYNYVIKSLITNSVTYLERASLCKHR